MSAKKKPGWDQSPGKVRKVNANAKIKNLPAADQETLWLLMHPTDDTVTPYTVEAAMVYLQEEHGIECAVSTFYEWHAYYEHEQRMDAAWERSQQAKFKYAQVNPKASLEELEDMAQFVFTSETMENKDVLNFTRLKRLRLQEETVKQKDQDLAQKDRLLKQKDKLIAQNERKVKLLEAKADRLDALEAKAKEIRSGGGLTAETLELLEKQLKLL